MSNNHQRNYLARHKSIRNTLIETVNDTRHGCIDISQLPYRLRMIIRTVRTHLKIMEIDCGLTLEEMEAATLRTVDINRPAFPTEIDFQIMHNVSRGPLGQYASVFPDGLKSTVVINCWPLTEKVGKVSQAYDTGLHAVTPAQRSVPARLIDPKIKSDNSLRSINICGLGSSEQKNNIKTSYSITTHIRREFVSQQ